MWVKKWLKELAALIVIMLVIISAVDWWRAPKMPENANLSQQLSLTNQPIDINQMSQNKPVLLYFWATWCGVCKSTTPMVRELANENIQVVTIAVQSGIDAELQPILARTGFNLPTINDPDGWISDDWEVDAMPTFVIIYQGNIVHSTTGWSSSWGLKLRLWLTTVFN